MVGAVDADVELLLFGMDEHRELDFGAVKMRIKKYKYIQKTLDFVCSAVATY
jgi:hypothetical protein